MSSERIAEGVRLADVRFESRQAHGFQYCAHHHIPIMEKLLDRDFDISTVHHFSVCAAVPGRAGAPTRQLAPGC